MGIIDYVHGVWMEEIRAKYALTMIVKMLKAGKYTIEEIATLVDKAPDYIQSIQAQLQNGELE